MLTIVTEVPDEAYSTGVTSYSNSASIRWDSLSGPIGTGNIKVGIGYNAITKSGVPDPLTRKIGWTVTVDAKGQTIPDLKVYDLLVYGSSSSGFDLSKAEGIPVGIKTGDLKPRYDQKYVSGSFNGAGLSVVQHSIQQDGEEVADLLEITGFSKDVINSFTFDSLVVNPDIFAGNKTSSVWNTATLFSANAKLNEASDEVSYTNKVLSKALLKRDATPDPVAKVNTSISKKVEEGFNYQDKSVIFRLSINADGLDLGKMTNAAGQELGTITVIDTLPDGWEFTDIVGGSKYLIFEGTGNSDGTVQATDTTPDSVVGLNASISGTKATFTFDELDQAYVILLKAKPTSETAAAYFNANKTTTVRNNLLLKATNWETGVTSFQDVSIKSQILEKAFALLKAGEVRWTVDYKPYDLPQPGQRLEDELPPGIELRTNANGDLLLSDGNIEAYEMNLNADGSYSLGTEITLESGKNISYNSETRVLSFIIPNQAKAYRFSYITDITGEPGTISNKVVLYGADSAQENTAKPYAITKADGEASMKKNGWILINKIDGNGDPLAGADFTILALDGKTVIRTGTTGSDGTIRLKVIPDGNYILLETAAPSGYIPEIRTYSLAVATIGSAVSASIDGKTGTDANTITIQNFPEGTVGNLTISKTVTGSSGDTTKAFDFTVTFVGAGGTYSYIGNGVPNGEIKSGETVSLAHGQSIIITGLPKGASYTVSEADYSSDSYETSNTGATGTIVADATQATSFVNKKIVPSIPKGPEKQTGDLTISKTVIGSSDDTTKTFKFTITFDGADGTYNYTGNGVPDGTIKSGKAISLAHGQSITITGLPKGAQYKVIEADYSGDGYSASNTGATGIIVANTTQTAAFANTKDTLSPEPEPDNGTTEKEVEPGGYNDGSPGVPSESIEPGQTDPFVNTESSVPQTGDDSFSRIWEIGLAVSAFMLMLLIGLNFVFRNRNGRKSY